MGYQFYAGEPFRCGRGGAEEHTFVVEQDSSGVLHPAELEAGDYYEIVFLEGTGDPGVLFQPVQGLEHLGEDVVQLRQLGRVGFAVEDAHRFSAAVAGVFLPHSRRKRKQVSAKRRSLQERNGFAVAGQLRPAFGPVGHGFPTRRYLQGEGETAFKVGLVEAGKDGSRPVGDKQRVQIICVAVQRAVAREEFQLHAVIPLPQQLPVQDNMLVLPADGAFPAVHFKAQNGLPALPEIQLERSLAP